MEHKFLLELTEISNFFLAKPWFFSQTSIILFHIFHGVSFVVLNYMFRLQRRSEHNAVIRRYSCVCGIQTVRNNLCVGRRSVLPFFRKHKWWMIANIVCHDLSCGGRRMSRMSRSLGYFCFDSEKGRLFWKAHVLGCLNTRKKKTSIHVVFPPPAGSRLAKEFASHHWAIGPQLQPPKT